MLLTSRLTKVVFLLFFLTTAAIPGPPRRFSWSASVDPMTGVAYSHEHSLVNFTRLHRIADLELLNLAVGAFGSYPQWLAETGVSLGLLRAIPLREFSESLSKRIIRRGGSGGIDRLCGVGGIEAHAASSGLECVDVAGVAICDAAFGFNLLSFGNARATVIGTSTTPIWRRGAGVEERRAIVDFPVIGGLLARTPEVGSNGRRGGYSCGCVRFAIVQRKSMQRDPSCGHFWSQMAIESEVTDGYRPAIVGEAPVGHARRWIYRSTQSHVHAYVMWRFHDRCAAYLCDMFGPSPLQGTK